MCPLMRRPEPETERMSAAPATSAGTAHGHMHQQVRDRLPDSRGEDAAPSQRRLNCRQPARAISPRLLDVVAAAAYLSVSVWTLRDLIARGLVPVVRLPAVTVREGARQSKQLRRVLIDVKDLDAFADSLRIAR